MQTDLAERYQYFIVVTKQFTSQILLIITCCITRQMRCSLAVLFFSKTSKYTLTVTFIFSFQITLIFLTFIQNSIAVGIISMFALQNAGVTVKQLLSLLHLAPFIWHLILKPVSQSYFSLAILGGKECCFIFSLLIIHLIWYLFRIHFEALNRYFIFHLDDGKNIHYSDIWFWLQENTKGLLLL